MVPDLTALISPVAALVPAAASTGDHPLAALLADADLSAALTTLPTLAEAAITGAAGTAVTATLTDESFLLRMGAMGASPIRTTCGACSICIVPPSKVCLASSLLRMSCCPTRRISQPKSLTA